MKTSTLLIFLFLSTFLIAQEFQVPESATFDPNSKSYFVSNFGNGNIIQIDSTGKKSIFKDGLSKSLGIAVHENTLFVVTNLQMIKGFNLNDKNESFEITIKEAKFLNDLALDNSGFIYVTDSNASSIFKIDIVNCSYSLLTTTELDNPNGIIFDQSENRLVFCYFRKDSRIDAIDIESGKISVLMSPEIDNLDGITIDQEGDFLISSWGPGSFATGFSKTGTIFEFEKTFRHKPNVFSSGHHGPADIYFVSETKEVLVPLFLANDLKIIKKH